MLYSLIKEAYLSIIKTYGLEMKDIVPDIVILFSGLICTEIFAKFFFYKDYYPFIRFDCFLKEYVLVFGNLTPDMNCDICLEPVRNEKYKIMKYINICRIDADMRNCYFLVHKDCIKKNTYGLSKSFISKILSPF